MTKKIFSVFILLSFLFCGCATNKNSESSEENSLQSTSEESSNSTSTQQRCSYSTIYGEYNDDVLIGESDFNTILHKCFGESYRIFDQKKETKYNKISYKIFDEFIGEVEIYDSIADAKTAYKDWFIITEGRSDALLVYLYLENVVRIGNVIIVGDENAIKPICEYYNINVETKTSVIKTEAINRTINFSIKEIETYMSGKGYKQYDSQVNGGLTKYKAFINFKSSDIGSIITLETSEKAKKFAESFFSLHNDDSFKGCCSVIYFDKYMFISKGEFWGKIFDEMESNNS